MKILILLLVALACSAETVEEIVGVGTDDGHEFNQTSWFDQTNCYIGAWSDGGDNDVAARFQTVAVPQGATIISANFRMTAQSLTGTASNVTTRFYLEDTDDAAAPGGSRRPSQLTGTTAYTDYTPTAWVTDTQYSVDLVDEVQEVVNRPSWASGNDMLVFSIDQATPDNNLCNIYPYDQDPAKAMELDIVYTTDGAARRYSPLIMD
jgi:hypothetical protein